MSKNLIQVFEYSKLKYSEHSDFKESHFNALVQFNEKNHNKYFSIIHRGVQFGSYVGVIQIGGLTIEILPKADKDNSNSFEQKTLWQNILLNMLRVCKHIQVDNVSETSLKKRYNSILDVYFEMYLTELEHLIQHGLIKKYNRVQSNQTALKGKLIFSQNIQKNLVHKERFYCEHQVYEPDHMIHQILFKGLKILENLVNPYLKDKLYRILYEFSDFKEINVSKSSFDKLVLDRKSIPYSRALDISKMIILNYSPSIQSGQDNMLTLLFDMNKLWEEYIYRILKKYSQEGFEINGQEAQKFWKCKKIKPDLVLKQGSETFIIDTKWKIIEETKPSDDDLKQMFAYNLYWKSQKSILLYPRTNQTDSDFGNYHFSQLDNNQCKLGFVDLIYENRKIDDRKIVASIFDKFN